MLVSDFSVVDAVAASPWIVYVATRHGLLLYDRRARSWRLPVTTLDGYPSARVRTALADPAGNAVWLGTTDGWARYDADLQRWEQGTTPGGVSALLLDAGDAGSGVFLRDLTGWQFLPRGALLPISGTPLPPPDRRVAPLDVQAALAATPMAQAMRALILTDPRLRNYQFTGAARTADNDDLFMGTNGLGLVRIDAAVGQWEPLTFTLLGARADALALGPDGVWVAGAATREAGGRSGVTWLASDLSATTPVEPAAGADFGIAAVRRLLAVGGALWIATDAGVYRMDPATGRTRRFGLEDGLPSEDVRALARSPDGVWIGTTRGLAVITGEKVARVGTFSQPVTCLLAVGDTLWVGSTAGLGVLTPGAAEPVVPPDVAAEPALQAPVVALVRAGGDTLVAVQRDQVAWRDPATAHWTLERPRATLGTLTAASADGAGVWLGGTIGLAWWDIARGIYRRIDVPGDLPAPVRDVAAAPPWIWVATDSGAVRLSRAAVTGESRR
ncbi:MAG TPA: two-component regulator propeller domain-containing protein [Gemmatimonadales bacterium]|nr:two-component regulator propeller domain-containing protein [Gemmatimonadales bacterium]